MKTSTGIPPGEFSLICSFDDAVNNIVYDKEKIHVYDQPRISKVSPNETAVNTETNVTVTGSGFVNSSTLMCVIVSDIGGKRQRLKAIFVNSTTIKCLLRSYPRAQHGKISLLSAPGTENEKVAWAMAMKFLRPCAGAVEMRVYCFGSFHFRSL